MQNIQQKRAVKLKPKPRELAPREAERITSATYNMGQRLVELTPRERFIVLASLCSTFLSDGDDESGDCARQIGKGFV